MSDSTTPQAPTGKSLASVYQYFDRSGVLIYIGVTSRGLGRNIEHAKSKEWWPFVARQEVEHYQNYEQALQAEKALIKAFRPPFNKQHNPLHRELRARYLYSALTPEENDDKMAFQRLYQRLDHKLPLAVMPERNKKNVFTLVSLPEHYIITQALESSNLPFGAVNTATGRRFGIIQSMEMFGGSVLLRGKLFGDIPVSLDNMVAKLKVVSLKKPVACLVTSVWADMVKETGMAKL